MKTNDIGDGDIVVHDGLPWVVEKTVVTESLTSHKVRAIGTLHSKLVFSEALRKVMTKTENLPSVEVLKQMSYDAMYVEDFVRDGEIAKLLNEAGLAYGTTCPECCVDDFTHVEGCSKQRLFEDVALES